MKFAKDNTIKLTKKRKESLQEYLGLQEDFKKLQAKSLCTHIAIYKEQEEWIDDTGKPLDKEKDKPVIREYIQYYIAPYYVVLGANGKEVCLDNLETNIIDLFNERIKIKLDTYKEFID